MTRVGLVILRRSPFARGCIGTCTSTVLNAPLERSFAAVGRYEKYVKNPKKTKITPKSLWLCLSQVRRKQSGAAAADGQPAKP